MTHLQFVFSVPVRYVDVCMSQLWRACICFFLLYLASAGICKTSQL